ncbi:MAG: DHH family phosphoesterase [Candidatus Berkelbacteria bacterium]|nr:DHH family phosphoesterase [Candidatus Berkelbacteria bacterium]
MTEKILVTDALDPDLDGTACIVAYSEFLRAKGQSIETLIFGTPQEESAFVLEKLGIEIPNGDDLNLDFDQIILVDTSGARWLSKKIDPAKVCEVIDHREVADTGDFPNAKIQLEMVGSCATLIAEKFIAAKIVPSEKSAIILYAAIISNTINFKNKVTTKRDKKAAKWLVDLYGISDEIIHQMFEYKSDVKLSIKQIFQSQIGCHTFVDKKVSTFQLEIIGVKEFITNNLNEIKKELILIAANEDYFCTLFTCVDIELGNNTFVVADKKSEDVVAGALGVEFKNGIAHYPHVIMRKEILPKIKNYLENRSLDSLEMT